MVIEESVLIDAKMETVWEAFTDLSCWRDWVRVVTEIEGDGTDRMREGGTFRFCIRPFSLPIHIEPLVEEVVPRERVVWSGSKFGVFARHEFIFRETGDGVLLTSRETFSGAGSLMFPERTIRELTASILGDLKEAAEIMG